MQIERSEPSVAASPAGSLEMLYSDVTVDHIANPRNLGMLEAAHGIGIVDDTATENLIMFYVSVADGLVTEARFRALACSACIAATSITTELVLGRTLAAVERITDGDILHALGGLPEAKLHCAALAAEAARRAIQAARERSCS